TQKQRNVLFSEIEKYALATAGMNYCGRPPFLEKRVRTAAAGCVTPQSLDAVEARFREEVAKWSGRTDCADKRLQSIMNTAERKFRWLLDDIKRACRLRVLYKFRLY